MRRASLDRSCSIRKVPAAVDQVGEVLEAYVNKCSKRASKQRNNGRFPAALAIGRLSLLTEIDSELIEIDILLRDNPR